MCDFGIDIFKEIPASYFRGNDINQPIYRVTDIAKDLKLIVVPTP